MADEAENVAFFLEDWIGGWVVVVIWQLAQHAILIQVLQILDGRGAVGTLGQRATGVAGMKWTLSPAVRYKV
jgi:hypothetical protein